MSALLKKITAATAAIDEVALAPGVDRGSRAFALGTLAGEIEKRRRRLVDEDAAERRGRNPVSQGEGD